MAGGAGGGQGHEAEEQGGPSGDPPGTATGANCQGGGQKARRPGGHDWSATNNPAAWGTATRRDGSDAGEAVPSSNSSHGYGEGPKASSWSESGAAQDQMAIISTGKESAGHSLALWEREAQTKQAPVLRASQHCRTLARTAAGFMTVSQHDAACPR